MKKTFGVIALLLTATVALAGKTGDDTWQIGNPTSTNDKKVIFDTGDGVSNKAIVIDHTTKKMSTNVDELKVGSGSAANQSLIFNRGGSNPVLRWNESNSVLEFANDGSSFTNIGSGSGGGGGGLSILGTNPDFEQSLALGWTATGMSFTAVSSGANLLFGKGSALLDSSATGQSLKSDAYAIPKGLYGANCAAQVFYKGGDATYKLQALDGSDALIMEQAFPGPSTNTTPFSINFPCPTSGSLKFAIASTADGAAMAIDRTSIGEAGNLSQVSQTYLIGRATFPGVASCAWINTSTSFAAFPADSDCTLPAGSNLQGNIAAPATKIPGFVLPSVPAGDIYIIATAGVSVTVSNAAFKFFDGTNYSKDVYSLYFGGSQQRNGGPVIGHFHYTTPQSNVTFQIHAKVDSGATGFIYNDSDLTELTFSVFYYPSGSQLALKPDQVANSWSGYHDSGCMWSSTNTGAPADPAIDSSCNLVQDDNTNFGTVTSYNDGTPGNNYPGITFMPSRPGRYLVCSQGSMQNNSDGQALQGQLYDVTNSKEIFMVDRDQAGAGYYTSAGACGFVTANSIAPHTVTWRLAVSGGTAQLYQAGASRSIFWHIFQIDQQLPAPLLVNSVVTPSAGVSNIVYSQFGSGNCPSDPCTIDSQSGGISVVNKLAVGDYAVHFSAGTFSQTPVCTANSSSSAISVINIANTSSTLIRIFSASGETGAPNDRQINLICAGPK